jgi:stearoyl-CoA desaturase (delta-9 desaturase)
MSTTNHPANSTPDAFANAPQIWVNTWLFVLTFLGAVIIVPWYGIVHGYSTAAWLSFAILLGANGMSITAGYHRLWAHRTYEAHWSVRVILMLFGAMALESSILAWSSGHRRHHLYIDDNERDPYSARRGFWFSHIGWMLRDYPSGRRDDSNIADVVRDPIAVFQDRHYVPLVLVMNIGLPLTLGWLVGDLWGVFLLGGLLRLVVSQHTTFFINSLAHMWGNQPYTDANTARDNGFLALLTYGEGYHNFHHCYAADYRNGVRWWQWDPTKWLIFTLSKVGLAWKSLGPSAYSVRATESAIQVARRQTGASGSDCYRATTGAIARTGQH